MADIGERVGMRGPSLYRHVQSKQSLLVAAIKGPMSEMVDRQRIAEASSTDVAEQLSRMIQTHVRFHAQNRAEAYVGNYLIDDLEEPARSDVIRLRRSYELRLMATVQRGVDEGRFHVRSPRSATVALLDMGIGISRWFRPDRGLSVDELAFDYVDLALALVGASTRAGSDGAPRGKVGSTSRAQRPARGKPVLPTS